MNATLCSFHGCTRMRAARGLCRLHYKQQRNGKTLKPLKENKSVKPCKFNGCNYESMSQGYCSSHAKQLASGKTLKPLRSKKVSGVTHEEHFWSRVDKTNNCWNWQGPLTPSGYGELRVDGKHYLAHRYSMYVSQGHLTLNLIIDHTCGNRACVRPEHLRETDSVVNGQNRHNFFNTTGVRNVFPVSDSRKYRVQLSINNKSFYIGRYDALEDADKAAQAARKKYYPGSQN